jgi:hypothetical protein
VKVRDRRLIPVAEIDRFARESDDKGGQQ